MARTVGFTLSIGARLQSSVASAFDTVAGRAGRLKREMGQLKAVSGAAGKLTASKATLDSLRAEAAAGRDVAKELHAAERAYASAQRQAAKYNITVGEAAAVHAKATAQMQRSEAALKRQETIKRNREKRDELKGEIFGTVASLAVVAAPVKMAIDFESAMADAAKTIDGMRDSTGKLTPKYYELEGAVKQMGRELPLTHDQLARLFAAGGQMGMSSVEELREFTTLAAHMSVAFGMSTDAAADSIGGFRSALGLSMEETREALDLMNFYANTSSATESSIANIVGRIGSIGKISGVSHQSVTAMAATLASMKIPDEVAGTGLKNFLLAMTKGGAAAKGAKEALAKVGIDSKALAKNMQVNAEGTMMAVMQDILKLPAHLQAEVMTEIFGTESLGPIAPMLTQLEKLQENLAIAGDKTKWKGALLDEFANRSKTTANALILLKNKSSELSIGLGSVLLPTVVAGANALGRFLEPVIAYSQANPAVVSGAFALVGGLVAIRVAALAGGFGLTALSNAATVGRVALTPLVWLSHAITTATFRQAVATKAAAVGQRILNVAMIANPIGLVITAVAGLAAWFAYLYNETGSVGGALSAMWDGCVAGLKLLVKPLEWALSGIGRIVSWLGSSDAKDAQQEIDAGLAKTQGAGTSGATAQKSASVVSGGPNSVMRPPAVVSSHSAAGAAGTSSNGGAATGPTVVSAPPSAGTAPAHGPQTAPAAVAQPPNPATPPSPASALLSQWGSASSGTGAGMNVGMGVTKTVTLSPNFNFNFSMDGIPDREFGKRTVDAVQSEQSSIARILTGLLHDADRLAYE